MGVVRQAIWLMVVVVGITLCAEIVLATDVAPDPAHMIPEPPATMPWWGGAIKSLMDQFPDVNGWFVATMVFLMAVMRAVSELLLFVAEKTDTKTDDKWAAILAKSTRWLAAISGWFGVGKSKKLE